MAAVITPAQQRENCTRYSSHIVGIDVSDMPECSLELQQLLGLKDAAGQDTIQGLREAQENCRRANAWVRRMDEQQALGVYFSPHGDLTSPAAMVWQLLNGAAREVLLAMYSFTNEALADALITARRRGVRVCIVLDQAQTQTQAAQAQITQRLTAAGCTVVLRSGPGGAGSMHLKMLVVDRTHVASGSYNYTNAASSLNHEILTVNRQAPLLAQLCAAQIVAVSR